MPLRYQKILVNLTFNLNLKKIKQNGLYSFVFGLDPDPKPDPDEAIVLDPD
jgi:hypothetical protein